MKRKSPIHVFLIIFLTLAGSTTLWEVVDIIGTDPVNFGTVATVTEPFAIRGESIFGDSGGIIEGYSVGLWAKRNPASSGNQVFFHIYGPNNSTPIFAVKFLGTATNTIPFQVAPLGQAALVTETATALNTGSVTYSDYWVDGSWTFFFYSYQNTMPYNTFVYMARDILTPAPYKNDTFSGSQQNTPDHTSTIWIGSTSTKGQGCKCAISQVRFYKELFENDPDLMGKFSDYTIEKIYIFDFTALASNNQNFTVTRTTLTFAINAIAVQSSATDNSGVIGLDTTGTASDPSFGPFFIRCSGSQIASYTLEGTLGSDITIFLGFRILISSSSDPQTILGIREATNVVFLVQYLLDGSLQFASDNNIIKTPVSTINQNAWYTLLINSHKQKLNSEEHFTVYLNSNPTPLTLTGVTETPYIPETTAPTFYACGATNAEETTIDISHLQIYTPTGGMYEEPDDNADCLLFFHYGSEMQVCGLCASGKYFHQTSCVLTCPPGYFEHESGLCQPCGTAGDFPKIANYLSELPPFPTVTLSLDQGDSGAIESCQTLTLTATLTSETGCSPYTYSWSYESNGSNTTARGVLDDHIASQTETDPSLLILEETLEFGVTYNFTFTIKNYNDVKSAPTLITFTTIGGHACYASTSFPSFSITCNTVSPSNFSQIILFTIAPTGPTVSKSQPTQVSIAISNTTTPTADGPFTFDWSVNLNISNTTEVNRLQGVLNADHSALAITLDANTLLEGVEYTLTATIQNSNYISGSSQSVVFTPVPFPDFSVIVVNGTTLQYCSDNQVSITIHDTSSSVGSFGFTWSVETFPSNSTENTRLAASINSSPDPSKVVLKAKSLLVNVEYTIKATIRDPTSGATGQQEFATFTVESGNRGLNCMGCVAPLYLLKNECVDQCPPYYKVIVRSDPIWGDTRYCLAGKDVKIQVTTTSLPEQIMLQFSEPILSLFPDLETQLFVSIKGFTLEKSNYTFSIISNKTIQIDLKFDERIPGNTLATAGFVNSYLQNVTEILMANNYRLINQNASVKLLEYYPFSPAQKAMISTTNAVSESGGTVITATLVVSQIAGGGGSSLLGASFACELIQMYKFIDVNYPPNLLLLFNGSFESPVSLQLPISLDGLNVEIDTDVYLNVHDGSKFETYDMNPYFIQNGISELATVISLLGVLGLVKGLKKIKRIKGKYRKYLNKLEAFIGWNYILLTIISANTKVTLYLAVNIAYPDFTTDLGRFCFILSMSLSAGLCLLIFVLSQFVMKKFREITARGYYPRRRLTQRELEQKRKDKRLDVIIEEYETNKFWQAAYIPLFLVRTAGISVILVLFKFYGLTQALAIEALNAWFLGYLIYHKPLKEKKDLYIQITYEAFNVVIGFIIIILNFLDISGDTESQMRINCGWAIIGLNFAVLGFSVILGVISGIVSIIQGIKWIRNYLKARKNRTAVAQSDQPTNRTHPVRVSRVNRMDAVRALQSTTHDTSFVDNTTAPLN